MVGIPAIAWTSAAMVFLAVTAGAIGIALLLEWVQERARRRGVLEQLRSFEASVTESATGGILRNARRSRAPAWLQKLASRVQARADLELLLLQAGSTWTAEAFLVRSAGFAVAVGLTVGLVTWSPFLGLVATPLGGSLPLLYLRWRRRRRMLAFEEGLPEAIDLLARAIRAGHPLSSGLQMVADETGEPIAGEFRRSFEEQRFGLPFDDAIAAMADRVAVTDVKILVTAILVQRVVGGNLAEVLDNLASVIRVRFNVRRQIRTFTAQGRLSGYLLAALPVVVGTIIHLVSPEYSALLLDTATGRVMLTAAILMQFCGYLWIRKIVNIEI